jgi:hypothetical protein
MRDIIVRILNESCTAPSPDNFQPWRFEVTGMEIKVFKVPGKVNHLLDFDEHVLLLTEGMVIENIVIAASAEQIRCAVTYFPDGEKPDCVARIVLSKDDSLHPDPLAAFLHQRCTNRKMYSKQKISVPVLQELESTLNDYPGLTLTITSDTKQIKDLGKAVSAIDQVMFENKRLHDSLFEHITWSKEEEQRTHVGLSLDSMEFKAAEKLLFKGLKNWSLVNALNMTGFSRFVRFKNSMQYGSAAASALVSARKGDRTDYLDAGRFVQRFWLKATRAGLSLHPIVGVIYCSQKVDGENNDLFASNHKELLRDSYDVLQEVAGSGDSPVVFFCRLGYAKKTSYQSTRKPAEIIFRDQF